MGETSPKLNFSILPADSEVGVSAQKLLFIGQKTSGGTATAGTLIQDIPNDNSWDTLFGAKSILANMIRRARQLCTDCGYQVQIDAIALDDDGSAVASSATIAFTGTATASGELNIVVGSKYYHNYTLSIASGKTASEIATAFKALVDADTKVPFTATVSSGTVTLTFANAGSIGNNTALYYTGNVAGVSVALTAFASGATDPTVDSTLLALINNIRYQGIVSPIEYGITDIKTMLDARFNANNKILDGVLFVDKTDTLANHKTALNALNSPNIHYQCDKLIANDDYKGSSIAEFSFAKAVYNATMRALRNSEGSQLSTIVIGQYPSDLNGGIHLNSLPFFNSRCAYLLPVNPALHWSGTEIEELKTAGGSAWSNNNADNTLVMNEQVTTYKTDNAGNADITWKYLNYRDTGSAIREYRFVNFKKDFAQSRMSSDTEKVIRNAFLKYYKLLAGEDNRLLREGKEAYNFYRDNLKLSLDYANGRVTVYCLDPIQTQLREVIGYFKVTFNLETGEAVE